MGHINSHLSLLHGLLIFSGLNLGLLSQFPARKKLELRTLYGIYQLMIHLNMASADF